MNASRVQVEAQASTEAPTLVSGNAAANLVGSWRYHVFVDALERDDRERSLSTPPEVKLAQALEMMAAGMRIARAKLEREHPDATAAELDELSRAWLAHED